MNTLLQTKRNTVKMANGYIDYEKKLSRFVLGKIHDRALGEDLVQDTFLKTWKYLVKGGKIDKMEAFLYHILKALIIDEYRKHKPVSLDVLLEKGFDPAYDTVERLIDTLDGRQLLKVLEQLPPRYQKVMQLRYVQDLSLEEIALVTKQTRNTVAVQTHRGLAKLKELYRLSVTQNTHSS